MGLIQGCAGVCRPTCDGSPMKDKREFPHIVVFYVSVEIIRDFKDTVYPFFESDALFLECVCCGVAFLVV